jgi:hypothetical protein
MTGVHQDGWLQHLKEHSAEFAALYRSKENYTQTPFRPWHRLMIKNNNLLASICKSHCLENKRCTKYLGL